MGKESDGKTLILIRHAHRDVSDREADNGLSEKGREQARALEKEFRRRFPKTKATLLSSPKKRCQETLEPIAKALGVSVKVDPRLTEQEHEEKIGTFQERIEDFLEEWKEKAPPVLVACSHGDWLPLALEILTGEHVDMKKGAWAEVTWNGKKARLRDLLQKL